MLTAPIGFLGDAAPCFGDPVFTAEKLCGTAIEVDTGGGGWANEVNITDSDPLTKANFFYFSPTTTNILRGTNFGFSIPAGAELLQFKLRIRVDGGITDTKSIFRRFRSATNNYAPILGNEEGFWPLSATDRTTFHDVQAMTPIPTVDEVNSVGFGWDLKAITNDNSGGGAIAFYFISVEYRPLCA